MKSCKSEYQITSVVTRDLQLCFLHLQTRIWTFELDWERRLIRSVRFLLHGPGPTPQLHLISSLTCRMTCGCPMLLVLEVLHLPPRSRCASMISLKVRWDCLIHLEFDYQSSAWFGWALEEGKRNHFFHCLLSALTNLNQSAGPAGSQIGTARFINIAMIPPEICWFDFQRERYQLEALQGHCGDLDSPLLRRSYRDHQLQPGSQTVL